MDRSTFRKIVLKSAFQKRKMYESFLENVSLLKHLEVSNAVTINATHSSSHNSRNKQTINHTTEGTNILRRPCYVSHKWYSISLWNCWSKILIINFSICRMEMVADNKRHKFLLQKYERENIADALVSQAFAKGQEVVKQASVFETDLFTLLVLVDWIVRC